MREPMPDVTLRPRHLPGTRLEQSGGRVIVCDADRKVMLSLNESAAALWELCDGSTTVEEMVMAICEVSSLPVASGPVTWKGRSPNSNGQDSFSLSMYEHVKTPSGARDEDACGRDPSVDSSCVHRVQRSEEQVAWNPSTISGSFAAAGR